MDFFTSLSNEFYKIGCLLVKKIKLEALFSSLHGLSFSLRVGFSLLVGYAFFQIDSLSKIKQKNYGYFVWLCGYLFIEIYEIRCFFFIQQVIRIELGFLFYLAFGGFFFFFREKIFWIFFITFFPGTFYINFFPKWISSYDLNDKEYLFFFILTFLIEFLFLPLVFMNLMLIFLASGVVSTLLT